MALRRCAMAVSFVDDCYLRSVFAGNLCEKELGNTLSWR